MEKLIILIVLIIGAIAIAQLVRVYELTSKLKKGGEHEVTNRDNNLNAKLMLGFMMFQFLGFIYLMLKYGWTGRGEPASLQGVETDWLLNVNFVIVIFVFFVTNFLLFYFSYRYVRKPGVKATFITHDNKLELIWTAVPAVVMAVIIILGLRAWSELTSGPTKDSEKIELFAEQFQWTARYSGEDNVLGKFDYKLTTGTNGLGLMTKATIDSSISEITNSIQKTELSLKLMHLDHLSSFYRNKVRSSSYKNAVDSVYNTIVKSESFNLVEAEEKLMKIYAKEIDAHGHLTVDVPGPNAETQKLIDKYEDDLIVKGGLLRSLIQMGLNHNAKSDYQAWNDIIQKDTLFLCKGREYEMSFRSKDVLHSAYFPHFRVQMNVVPGMPTRFKFTPSLTTKQMREKKKDSKFNFILMCNKICGTSHYKMKMIVVVYPKKEYQKWMNNKRENTFKDQYFPSEENTEASNKEI